MGRDATDIKWLRYNMGDDCRYGDDALATGDPGLVFIIKALTVNSSYFWPCFYTALLLHYSAQSSLLVHYGRHSGPSPCVIIEDGKEARKYNVGIANNFVLAHGRPILFSFHDSKRNASRYPQLQVCIYTASQRMRLELFGVKGIRRKVRCVQYFMKARLRIKINRSLVKGRV